jgi:hypothetical protein
MNELVEDTTNATEALWTAMHGVGKALEEFEPKSKEYTNMLRQFRMCAVAELGTALKQFEDVRKFFLSERHAQEVERLREFVSLCERLDALRRSGFLNAVADTILKLEE